MNSLKLIISTAILIIIIFINNIHTQWIQVNNGIGSVTVWTLASNNNNIFAGTDENGVFMSTNNGSVWGQTNLNDRRIRSLATNSAYLFAGTGNLTGIYFTTNNGTNWTQASLNNKTVYSLTSSSNNIYAGIAFAQGVYKSTDNGLTWYQTTLNNQTVNALVSNGSIVFAGSDNGSGVYKTTDNGGNWFQTSLNNWNIFSLVTDGNNLFAGTGNVGVFRSTNNGANWTQTSLNVGTVYALAINGTSVFAGTHNSGVIFSNNNGINWYDGSQGLGYIRVNSICILNNYLFAGTNTGIYRRLINEFLSIKKNSENIPLKSELFQNYPNPFNPETKIKFQIYTNGDELLTNLILFDVLGREVITLLNEKLKTGRYELVFNGSSLSSGIYFYQLSSGDYLKTRKMLLIK